MSPSRRHSPHRLRSLGLLLLLSLGCGSGSDPVDPDVGKKRLQVNPHRGARSFAPENTIPGYTAGLAEWDNEPGTPNSFFDPDPAKAGLWTGGVLVKDHGNSIPQMVKDMGGTTFDVALVSKLIDWGVDGIITDDPGQLISMLAARGYALPVTYR